MICFASPGVCTHTHGAFHPKCTHTRFLECCHICTVFVLFVFLCKLRKSFSTIIHLVGCWSSVFMFTRDMHRLVHVYTDFY